jgi:type 1 fimbria pilin
MKKILISSVLFTAAFGLNMATNAACTPENGFRTVDISMAVGRVVVRPSDPVGTILRRATFPISPNGSTYVCDRLGGFFEANLAQSYSLSPLGNSIYSTNISGIGIRLYREAENASNFSGYYPYRAATQRNIRYTLANGYFVVEIIKTATQTGSGALVPGRYSAYHASGYPTVPWLTSTVYGNAITIASSSCELLSDINKTVQLPTVMKSGFRGVGSIQGEQAFDLNILCNGGINPTGYEEKTQVSLSFDYTQDGSNNQVLTNTAPAATKANGVGVQLISNYQNINKVIARGDKIALGAVKSNEVIQYNLPLKARYYQTAANVTAGTVRAMATVTIQYD